ncbi:MAG: DegT/DnrJ/EryC1/StrS family aminotransferase [Desulfobacterales bacterium]|nr:DegT/DnrJ/EryC1/StrS family aminotransferase [Desulfobacterales bacterium]
MPGFEIFGDEERREVMDVLDTGVLMRYGFDQARQGHWKARTFEGELAKKLGTRYCHLCSSGTAALSTALAACGIGAGDEVIVPPFTFVATIEAVLTAGAIPIFANIDETLCLSPKAVAETVTTRTRAVIPVHMCGAMARIDQIEALCREQGLILVEDACQAVGGSYQGQSLGTFGKAGCFSFDPVKTITCGEGGAIITADEAVYRAADAYADHGHDHVGNDRGLEGHAIVGLNFRISELNAAVGLAQLRKLDFMLEKQRAAKAEIVAMLTGFPAVTLREIPDPEGDTATFLSFLMPDEERARQTAKDLAAAGVDGCFYWYDNYWHYIRQWPHIRQLKSAARLPIHLQENIPDYDALDLRQSDAIMGRTISMQIKLSWSEAELESRIEKMATVLRG